MLPSGSIPLFFLQNIPQYRSASGTAPSIFQACQYFPGLPVFSRLASIFQAVKVLTSPQHQGHTPPGQHTRTGKDSQYNDCYYNNN